ncbi:hypothetical protein [Streptomyces olivoreticuli]|uniref:hypothetical protein n=1 Tax=Streptomyces olivoreticuli TaxID=68246 RepID=UPI001968375D|nr:hypothetical protein [Streptomyces olivoreticuli]
MKTQFAHLVGPSAQPLVALSKAALAHGITQASIVLAAITTAGVILVPLWAPGRRPQLGNGAFL